MLNGKCKNCCPNVLRVTAAATSAAGNFILTTASTITPVNGCKYLIVIPCSVLPANPITDVEKIFVTVNGVDIPLQCILGNDVFTDQINCFNVTNCGNIVLRCVYGSTPAHFKIINQQLNPSTAY